MKVGFLCKAEQEESDGELAYKRGSVVVAISRANR